MQNAEPTDPSLACAGGFTAAAEGPEEIRRHCESAAQKLRAKSLRSVEMKYLQAEKSRLTPREYECAFYVVGEIARVVAAERALQADDHRQLGQYLLQSHEATHELHGNRREESELLVGLARRHPGCLGARVIGDGTCSATVNLVAYHQVLNFMETIARQYEERTGRKIKPFVCQIVEGAQ